MALYHVAYSCKKPCGSLICATGRHADLPLDFCMALQHVARSGVRTADGTADGLTLRFHPFPLH